MFFFLMLRRPPRSTLTDTLFPYTPLFRSIKAGWEYDAIRLLIPRPPGVSLRSFEDRQREFSDFVDADTPCLPPFPPPRLVRRAARGDRFRQGGEIPVRPRQCRLAEQTPAEAREIRPRIVRTQIRQRLAGDDCHIVHRRTPLASGCGSCGAPPPPCAC